jgi:hypothetical protein
MLKEIVAEDTYYSLVRNVSGYVYVQIYYGCTSHYINIYGLVRDVSGYVYAQIYYGCTSHYINVYESQVQCPKDIQSIST